MIELLPELNATIAYTCDPKDDKFVACAVAGGAHFLMTVDEDLLVLRPVGNVQIVTPAQLITQLNPP